MSWANSLGHGNGPNDRRAPSAPRRPAPVTRFSVSRSDSRDLGFAVSCLFAGAIDRAEFVKWVYWVIETSEEDLPHFFYELDDAGPYLKDLYAAIGFVPDSPLTPAEEAALQAIGYRRGTLTPDAERISIGEKSSPERAVAALIDLPSIEARFHAAFPFLADASS